MGWRSAAIALWFVGQTPSFASAADAHTGLLPAAQAALDRGDAVAAVAAFERAAAAGHGTDVEIGLVRAYMQAGEYRRALAFGAHVAGEHAGDSRATVLYAWLLRVGGQIDVAQRLLDEVLARAPSDELARAAERAFADSVLQPAEAPLRAAGIFAPVLLVAPGGDPVPANARIVSSGVLVHGGRHTLVPAATAGGSRTRRLWVRNALGQTSEATPEVTAPESDGLAVLLRLTTPLVTGVADAVAARDPFAGSPGFAIGYAEGGPATPAWPQLRQGFFGAQAGGTGPRRLGIDIGARTRGGPVLDASGRLTGIALRDENGDALLLPASKWPSADAGSAPSASGAAVAGPPSGAPMGRGVLPVDEVYERAMRITVQVIASP